MQEGTIQTSGGELWYGVYGEEKKGTPLLVLHGGPGFLSMPQVVCELADERPVYFYDQLGCGRSQRACHVSEYTLENYVNELDTVYRALDLKDFFLMGFSWGSFLACSYLLEKTPPGVKGVFLCGPLISVPRWDADQRQYIAQLPSPIRQAIEKGEEEHDYGDAYQKAMMQYYQRHVCRLDPWPQSVTEAFDQLNMDVYLKLWGPSEFTCTGLLKGLDLLPRLHEISVPVLLTCGDWDEAGVKTVKDYQIAFPNASMAVFPDSSHLHHLEKPQLFLAVVRDFLGQHHSQAFRKREIPGQTGEESR